MELRKIIRTDIAASALAHLTLVALVIVISEVHPFHASPPDTVTVDIVTPEQVKQEEARAEEKAKDEVKDEVKEKPPEPVPDLKLPKLDFSDKAEAAPKQQAAPQASQQKSAPEPKQKQPPPSQASKQREANVAPPAQQPPPSQQPPPQTQFPQPPQPLPQLPQQAQPVPPPPAMPQPQAPAYQVPEPDVTVKYGVMLGLPPELPPEPAHAPKDDGGDGKDSAGAKLPPEVVAALRRHLRSCSKLPAGVAPADAVRVKLRSVLATDGTLAREPILIEAPPSAKGVALIKAATSAIQACQPYKMLPAAKYEEWKVLDLVFTPQDFGG